ncbi:MAG: hydantoinase/oxoprolinase family protein [bacterium]
MRFKAASDPACYDRGGIWPTVTYANILAGLMHPESFVTTGIMSIQNCLNHCLRNWPRMLTLILRKRADQTLSAVKTSCAVLTAQKKKSPGV